MSRSDTPSEYSGLRMTVAAVQDAERALADLQGPDRGGDNNLRRLNSAAFVGERYGAALVADWRAMNGALKLIDVMLTAAEGDGIPRSEACKHQARLLARQILGWREVAPPEPPVGASSREAPDA